MRLYLSLLVMLIMSSCTTPYSISKKYEANASTIAYKKYLISYDRKVVRARCVTYYKGTAIVFRVTRDDIAFDSSLNAK